jgi:hypothetical protein
MYFLYPGRDYNSVPFICCKRNRVHNGKNIGEDSNRVNTNCGGQEKSGERFSRTEALFSK